MNQPEAATFLALLQTTFGEKGNSTPISENIREYINICHGLISKYKNCQSKLCFYIKLEELSHSCRNGIIEYYEDYEFLTNLIRICNAKIIALELNDEIINPDEERKYLINLLENPDGDEYQKYIKMMANIEAMDRLMQENMLWLISPSFDGTGTFTDYCNLPASQGENPECPPSIEHPNLPNAPNIRGINQLIADVNRNANGRRV